MSIRTAFAAPVLAALALATASGAALAGGGVYPPAADAGDAAATRTRAQVIEEMRAQAPNFRGDNYPLPVEARSEAPLVKSPPAADRPGAVVAWPFNPAHSGA